MPLWAHISISHFANSDSMSSAVTAYIAAKASNAFQQGRQIGSRPHLIHVPWAHPSQHPNGISIGSAIFAGLTNVTNRQTHRQTDHAAVQYKPAVINSNIAPGGITIRSQPTTLFDIRLMAPPGQLDETLILASALHYVKT